MTFTGDNSPLANLMPLGFGAFAKFERALLRERQREGIALFSTDPFKKHQQNSAKGNSWIETLTEVVERSQDLVLVRTKYSINEQRTGCKRPD